ncbi:vWA domain-containing protein [Candidatus Liberibacter solanacearum]|nr:vWA domain-containing protein [Candidatus Liberibacter solanacearum]
MSASIIFVCLIFVSFVIDITHLLHMKNHIQSSLDNAIISGCSIVVSDPKINDLNPQEERIRDVIKKNAYVNMVQNFPAEHAAYIIENANISFSKDLTNKYEYKITMEAKHQLSGKNFILGFLMPNVITHISSISTGIIQKPSDKKAFSVEMVLDCSGSMLDSMQESCDLSSGRGGYYFYSKNNNKPKSKIYALKTASSDFVNLIQETVQTFPQISARIGLITFNHYIMQDSKLSNNFNVIKKTISRMKPKGGTDTFLPMNAAYEYLNNIPNETKAHNISDNVPLKRYIILMTDGENNHPSYDLKTINVCDNARKNGIIIYSIFLNYYEYTDGYELARKCASSEKHFFYANNTKALLDSFKSIAHAIQDKAVRIASNE